eukprot:scaffold25862_cov93-Isochrysis_galbana.AAC.2
MPSPGLAGGGFTKKVGEGEEARPHPVWPHLVCVDGVVVQRPEKGAHVQRRHHRGVKAAVNSHPAQHRPPVDGETKNSLRPVGEPLGQGVACPKRGSRQPGCDGRHWADRKATAWRGCRASEARGRCFVRATCRSRSRSSRSFTVHPAPRIATAPAVKRTHSARSGGDPAGAARARLHRQGHRRSQVPMGRSHRASWPYGTAHAGSSRFNWRGSGRRVGSVVSHGRTRRLGGMRLSRKGVEAARRRASRARRTQPSLTMSVKPILLADAWTESMGSGLASPVRGPPLGRSSPGDDVRPDDTPRCTSCGGQQGMRAHPVGPVLAHRSTPRHPDGRDRAAARPKRDSIMRDVASRATRVHAGNRHKSGPDQTRDPDGGRGMDERLARPGRAAGAAAVGPDAAVGHELPLARDARRHLHRRAGRLHLRAARDGRRRRVPHSRGGGAGR